MPMNLSTTWRDYLTIRLLTNLPREIQRRGDRTWGCEITRMGHDAEETTQQWRADFGLAAAESV